jgi:alpha-tubulin suppressor-like RCC1 family protein
LLAAVLLGVAPVAQAAAAPPAPIYAFGTGLLGDGYTHSSATPQRVSALLNKRIIQVSSYSENGRRPDHTLALTEGGTIYSWGRNGHLQLGYGGGSSFAPKQVPTANSGLNSRVIAVAAGYQFSMALTAKGQVLTWGLASRLGDGSTVDRAKPTVITGLQGQYGSVISAGQTHAEVVTSAGQVWGWGTGGDGELGTGATADSAVPVSAELPPGFTAAEVVVGGSIVPDVGPVNFTLARSVDGQLLAWGANNFGQLGTGSTGPDQTRPVPVKVPADAGDILSLAAGGQNGGFITVDGRVVTWGQNIFGNLGNGTTTRDATPSYVTLPANATRVIRLSMSDYNTLISTDTSQVYGWGSNESWATGALGTTAVTHSSVPIPIDLPSANTYVELDAGGPTSYVVLRVP